VRFIYLVITAAVLSLSAAAADVSFEPVYTGLKLDKQRPVAATLCPD
jgi:hypothetical protein